MVVKNIVQTISNMWRGPRKEGGTYFYPLQNANVWGKLSYLQSFNEVPELNAVINLRARARSSGKLKIVDNNLKEVELGQISKVIKNPNWFQSQAEFIRQTALWHDIYGDEFLYTLFPVGFNIDRLKALFTLPPNLVEAEYEESQPFYTFSEAPENIKYVLDFNGHKVTLANDTIIHMNDNRVNIKSVNDKLILNGESKMGGLTPAINNIKMAYESRGVILKHRGALGILSNQSQDESGHVPLLPAEKESVQEAYRQYGGLSNQQQVIITSANLKWQQMSVNPDKLGLYQETEEDFNKILDSYGVPSEMFVRSKGATFENQKEARKSFYENTILPEANEWVGGLNARFLPDGKYKIIADFSHLPIFQEDIKHRSDAMNARVTVLSKLLQDKQISNEEYREELGKIGIGNGKALPIVSGDENQQEVETRQAQATLRGSVGGVQGVLAIQAGVSAGTTSRDSALSMLTIIFGFTDEQSSLILGQPSTQNTNEQEEQQ
jgi:HK97 family phage portal protein